MNKSELVEQIAKKTKLPKTQVDEIFSTIIEVIKKNTIKRKKVTLSGFGTFQTSKRKAQIRQNPRTGEKVDVPEKIVPVFVAHKKFKELVNKKK